MIKPSLHVDGHVAHHLFPQGLPHYHLKEATACIKAHLEKHGLGHYYRFTNSPLSKASNATSGQIYVFSLTIGRLAALTLSRNSFGFKDALIDAQVHVANAMALPVPASVR